jgi:hypothetical protein
MASIRISQLAEINGITPDDLLVVNDGDINTRKITFQNFSKGLVPLSGDSNITGNLTLSGALEAEGLIIDTDTLYVDNVNKRVGVRTASPEQSLDVLGNFQLRGNGIVRLKDPNNQFAVTFQTPVLTANTPYALPDSLPAEPSMVLSCSNTGAMTWLSAATDPMLQVGDMIYRNVLNETSRLPIGGNGQVLTVQADGTAQWANPANSFVDPMTNAGDIIIRDASNNTVRLGMGTAGQHLAVNNTRTALEWTDSSSGSTPTLNEVATVGSSTSVDLSVGSLLTVQGNGTFDGAIRLNCSANTHGVTIQSPPHSESAVYTLILPGDAGSNGQVLSTDGTGNLDWTDPAALSTYKGNVADEAAMIALSSAVAGDWCFREDEEVPYILAEAPYSTAANWKPVSGPVAAVTSVNGETGAVSLSSSDVGAATTAQGALADTAVQPAALATELANYMGAGVSADANNLARLGTDSLVYVPTSVVIPNNYKWSNAHNNAIGEIEITTDASDWANATKIFVSRKAKNNVDMVNTFNNSLLKGTRVFIQKTNDGEKFFAATIDSSFPIITGSGSSEVFEYSVTNVATTGAVYNDNIEVTFGTYADTNSYLVAQALSAYMPLDFSSLPELT